MINDTDIETATETATDQARYDDITCGYCDRPLVDRGDSAEVCHS